MQRVPVVEKIERLPGPLLREVEDFVDFLLARYGYGPGIQLNVEYRNLAAILQNEGDMAVLTHIQSQL